jgi:hypothetical protein
MSHCRFHLGVLDLVGYILAKFDTNILLDFDRLMPTQVDALL